MTWYEEIMHRPLHADVTREITKKLLQMLCLGRHRQQGRIKDSLFVWNVVQGGASVLFLFSYQFQTTQILR